MFILGIVVGFVLFKLFSGKYEGDKIENSLRFPVRDYYIHIHHWIWCSLLLLLFLILGVKNYFLTGFLIGSIIQGLLYRDRFIILYKRDMFDHIYSRFKK